MRNRFTEEFDFYIDTSKGLNNDILVPTMLIQSFVSNAIVHRTRPKDEKGSIVLRVTDIEDFIQIEVIDNGIGRKASQAIQSKGKYKPFGGTGNKTAQQIIDLIKSLKPDSQEHIASLEFIDREEENPEQTGLKVRMVLTTKLNETDERITIK